MESSRLSKALEPVSESDPAVLFGKIIAIVPVAGGNFGNEMNFRSGVMGDIVEDGAVK